MVQGERSFVRRPRLEALIPEVHSRGHDGDPTATTTETALTSGIRAEAARGAPSQARANDRGASRAAVTSRRKTRPLSGVVLFCTEALSSGVAKASAT